MPRRSAGSVRRDRSPAAPESVPSGNREELQQTRDGTFLVRNVAGASALKVYRCPGCQQEVKVGVPHVVVWPAAGHVTDRRHWHTSCWHQRATRGGPGPLPWTSL